EKGFQEGGKILREKGLHVESLAIIDSLQGGNIITR
ncbi:xanthine phosphoribosyltransferase, partial [Bacteroides pyogenes]